MLAPKSGGTAEEKFNSVTKVCRRSKVGWKAQRRGKDSPAPKVVERQEMDPTHAKSGKRDPT